MMNIGKEVVFAELCICHKLRHWIVVSGHGFNSLLFFGFVKIGGLKFCEYDRSAYSICRNFYEDISLIGVLELSCFIAVAECARRIPLATFFHSLHENPQRDRLYDEDKNPLTTFLV